jgi:ribosomal protein S27E
MWPQKELVVPYRPSSTHFMSSESCLNSHNTESTRRKSCEACGIVRAIDCAVCSTVECCVCGLCLSHSFMKSHRFRPCHSCHSYMLAAQCTACGSMHSLWFSAQPVVQCTACGSMHSLWFIAQPVVQCTACGSIPRDHVWSSLWMRWHCSMFSSEFLLFSLPHCYHASCPAVALTRRCIATSVVVFKLQAWFLTWYFTGCSVRFFWHGYVLHEGITYKSHVPHTSQMTSRLLRNTAAAMRAHNLLCNSYNTRPLLCAHITCYVTVITVEINHCSFRHVRFALLYIVTRSKIV